MEQSVQKEVADMLTELIFRFYSACQRHPTTVQGPKIHSHGFHVLYLLERSHEKKLSMSFLLIELQMTKQQMSKIINELEDFAFIERVRAGNDRRNVFVRLTEKGSAYFRSNAQAVSAAIEAALQKQSAERTDTVRDLLYRLMQD